MSPGEDKEKKKKKRGPVSSSCSLIKYFVPLKLKWKPLRQILIKRIKDGEPLFKLNGSEEEKGKKKEKERKKSCRGFTSRVNAFSSSPAVSLACGAAAAVCMDKQLFEEVYGIRRPAFSYI